jgi:hypothetical protein
MCKNQGWDSRNLFTTILRLELQKAYLKHFHFICNLRMGLNKLMLHYATLEKLAKDEHSRTLKLIGPQNLAISVI